MAIDIKEFGPKQWLLFILAIFLVVAFGLIGGIVAAIILYYGTQKKQIKNVPNQVPTQQQGQTEPKT